VPDPTIAELEAQEAELVLPSFDHDDARRLGEIVTAAAVEAGHPLVVDVRRPGLVLYRASLPGTRPDHEQWVQRKAAVVTRMEASSALVAARDAAAGTDVTTAGWPAAEYAVTGGAFPVRVAGTGVVAVVTASGLTSQEDHDLVVAGLRQLLAERAGPDRREG